MPREWKSHVVPLVAGGLAFAVAQVWLLATSTGSGTPDPGWFLNDQQAGLSVLATVALVSALVAAFRTTRWLASGATFTAGAVVAMTIVLFAIGPGTIFPIVIAVGTVVLAAAAFLGTGLGWLLRRVWVVLTT